MTADIQPGVRERAESPAEGREATLLVGYRSAMEESVVTSIEESGGDVEERLHYNTLAVSILEEQLSLLFPIEGITSVEFEGTWDRMGTEDFRSRTSSSQ